MQNRTSVRAKKILDLILFCLVATLMSFPVTRTRVHEWLGLATTALALVHASLNWRWFSRAFQGKYDARRSLLTLVNVLLLGVALYCALCGTSLSGYAVPFLNGILKPTLARRSHIALAHWFLALVGIHAGLNYRALFSGITRQRAWELATTAAFFIVSCLGVYYFLVNRTPDYLFFKSHFAFLDSDAPKLLTLWRTVCVFIFWGFVGCQFHRALSSSDVKKRFAKAIPILEIALVVATGASLWALRARPNENADGWSERCAPQNVETTLVESARVPSYFASTEFQPRSRRPNQNYYVS